VFKRDPLKEETVVNMLAAALRRDISFGVLTPDQKLKIDDLRSRYGGSKHSLRETLRLLSAEGLVEAVAQRGFRVTSASPQDLEDICMVRTEIERVALERALVCGGVRWEAEIVAAHHALQKLDESVRESADDLIALEWDEACRAFSTAIVSACESPRLMDLQKKYFDQSRRFRLALLREGKLDFRKRKKQQQALVDALISRDKPVAQRLLTQYVESELQLTV
jgi:DNA-binding GntR family transcriptional regulator